LCDKSGNWLNAGVSRVPERAPNMKNIWLYSFILAGLAGCAHQSAITPSQGHIGSGQDAQPAAAGEIPKPVKKPGYVPPPRPKTKEQTYSVVVSDVPVKEILFALARESKMNIDINPALSGNVTLNAVDQTLPAILERLGKQVDLRYKIEGNVLSIMPDIPTLRTYKINYVNMDRDTTSSIGVAAEISSTGSAASASGGSASSGSGNSSSTTVSSKSKNNFWEALSENIRVILKTTKTQTANAEDRAARAEAVRASQEDRLKQVEAVSKAGAGAEKLFQEAFKSQPTSFESKDEVILNPVAGTVTVMATERQHSFIQQYIDTVMASVQRQVLIETTIVEVNLSNEYQQGIDWSRLGSQGGNKGFTFQQTLGGAALATGKQFVVGYSNTASKLGDLAASLRLLETFGNAHVLSSPKLMAINNQTAILKVVDNLVYFTIKADTTTSSTGPSLTTYTTTPNTVPVGVVMSVTPQVNENGVVTLNVRPTISRKVGDTADPNPDLKKANVVSNIPQIQVREMESVLQVNSGQTVVLGGLMQDDVNNNTDSVPGLSKLPFVGKLFQGKDDTVKKTELVIFLRPTVIKNASLESDELKPFKQYLPEQLSATTDEPAH
jgi:MSHA type pilus biogenesis protein MshL